jgi:hypothetical protein
LQRNQYFTDYSGGLMLVICKKNCWRSVLAKTNKGVWGDTVQTAPARQLLYKRLHAYEAKYAPAILNQAAVPEWGVETDDNNLFWFWNHSFEEYFVVFIK